MKTPGFKVNRRFFLSLWGLSPLSCLPQNKSNDQPESSPPLSETTNTPEKENKDEGTIQEEVENPDFDPAISSDTCPPPGTIDLSTLPNVPEALTPTVKAYSPEKFALVAVGFQKYTHGKLKTVILCRSSGQTLFRKEISPADITKEDFIHPILFEGVDLQKNATAGNALSLVIQLNNPGGQEFYKSDLGNVEINNVTLGKISIKTLQSTTFTAEQSSHHRQGRFYPQDAALHNITEGRFSELIKAADFSQIDVSGIPYPMVVARQGSTYQPAVELQGTIITDLLGNPIATPGSFRNIIEHPFFISEKTVGSAVYRTLVRTN
ncbi:MAG: hypothetical protein AB8C84_05210 [Oligoflexales bacterium]